MLLNSPSRIVRNRTLWTLALLGLLAAGVIFDPLESVLNSTLKRGADEQVVTVLLLVPLAATVLVFLRTLVGLDTFGIFAPMILAIAFLQVGIVRGLLAFGAVLAIGTPVRLILELYPSLQIARTAVVVSVVALVLLVATFIDSLTGGTGLLGNQALPLVIMAGVIERFVTAQMDETPKEAAWLSVFTVLSSVLVWLVIAPSTVQSTLLSWPGLVLLSFPACLLMGRYSGLRFTELFRFRELSANAID